MGFNTRIKQLNPKTSSIKQTKKLLKTWQKQLQLEQLQFEAPVWMRQRFFGNDGDEK